MKKIIYAIILCLAICSCEKTAKEEPFTLEGTAWEGKGYGGNTVVWIHFTSPTEFSFESYPVSINYMSSKMQNAKGTLTTNSDGTLSVSFRTQNREVQDMSYESIKKYAFLYELTFLSAQWTPSVPTSEEEANNATLVIDCHEDTYIFGELSDRGGDDFTMKLTRML